MANDEHLALLRQGTVIWNEWRRSSPLATPDLKGANLSDAERSGSSLHQKANGVRSIGFGSTLPKSTQCVPSSRPSNSMLGWRQTTP
jgi:hypothetical protein